jgi:imidazolonepropionase-like amidohydrolase
LASATTTDTSDLLIRNGVALVGDSLEAQEFATIVVRDGIIVEVTPEILEANGRPEIDLEGKYLLPGLIDCHVHFDLAAHAAPYHHWHRSAFIRSMTSFHNGLRAIRAGITSVRDLGSADDLVLRYADQVDTGRVIGPRVVAAGMPIMMTGGHASEHGRTADGPDDVRLAVREQLGAGAGAIKFMASGGISTPGNPYSASLNIQEMRAGIDAAHSAGVLVAAHAHAPRGILNAIEAGVDTIEHAAFADEESRARLVEADITLVPTVIALDPIAPGIGIPLATVEKSLAARAIYRENTALAIEAGVRIAAGTDAGTAFNPIGDLLNEILTYVELGMSATEALRSATVEAGRLVRRVSDEAPVGILSIGARADLIIADKDPREDLERLRRPAGVVLGGKPVDLAWVEQTLAATEGILVEQAE